MQNSLLESLTTIIQLLNRIAKWLLLLAIIWLCWNIARIVWLVVAPPQAPNLPIVEIQTQPDSSIDSSSALAIFDSNRPTITLVQKPEPQVSLTGVMIAMPDSQSAAMLELEGIVASYRMAEPILDTGYKIVSVTWNTVILENEQGHQMTLHMPERMSLNQEFNTNESANRRSNRSGSNNLPVASNVQDRSLADQNDQMPLDQDPNNRSGRGDGNPPSMSPQAAIDDAVVQLKQDPAGYLSRMGVMATGEGYQVTDAIPAELKQRIGLEAGDTVLSVNGHNVGSNPASDADLLNQVKQSGEAQIEVKRGEQIITIRQSF